MLYKINVNFAGHQKPETDHHLDRYWCI